MFGSHEEPKLNLSLPKLPPVTQNARISLMKTKTLHLNIKKLDAKLRQWQRLHADPAKRATLYRRKILDWVVQSMAFENEPVSMARLKVLLKNRKVKLDS
jgi:hypothetical protein